MIKQGRGFKVIYPQDQENIFKSLFVFDKKTPTFASQF